MADIDSAREAKFVEVAEKKAAEEKAAAPATESKKADSKPAAKPAAEKKEEKPKEKKREIILERFYSVNLSDAYWKPRFSRSNRAVNLLRAFVSRHFKASEKDVRIAAPLNEYVRGVGSRPLKHVRVRATKDKQGVVLAEQA